MGAVQTPTEAGPQRRSVLVLGLGTGAALASGLLTGCSLNNPYNSDEKPTEEVVRDLSPDVGIAVDAVGLIHAGSDAVGNAVAHSPDLTPRLAGLTAGYAAYLEELVKAVPDGVDTSPGNTSGDNLPTSRAEALREVRRTTAATRTGLNGLALRAESGTFARLLGSMAAGLGQQLEVLAR